MKRELPFDSSRINQLASELTDGSLPAAQKEELRQLLATDKTAARWYCEWMSVHSQLQFEFANGELDLKLPRMVNPDAE